jgi:hypothetical protein
MRSSWRIASLVACVVVIGGMAILWSIHQKKTNEKKLVEMAQATRLLADKGDAQAEHDLGFLYSHGQGVVQDDAEAVHWYRESAGQGNAEGENGLGYMNEEGRGVEQDYGQALRLYRLAADQGCAKAQNNLGLMCSQGRGVLKDPDEALRWYRKAAYQGFAPAENNLGTAYYFGRGVQVNMGEATRWYREAADQGDEHAMRALGFGFTAAGAINLMILAIVGLALAAKPFSFNVFESAEGLQSSRQKLSAGTGLLFLFTAGLNWYGYAHYLMRSLVWGPNAFTVGIWLLKGVSFGLLGYIMLSKKKPEGDESLVTPA